MASPVRGGARRGSPMDLPRRMGVWSGAAVIVGLMIGSGIFRVPSVAAAHLNGVLPIVAVWAGGGLLALVGALCMAELATMYPRTGGVYVYLREIFGPGAAFVYGWTRLVVLAPASVGAIALICAAYLRPFVPVAGLTERRLAVGVILLVALLNYRSVVWSALTENVLSALKLAGLLVLAAACLLLGDGSRGALAPSAPGAAWTVGGAGLAMVTVMWSYSGWSSLTALAGEMKDPSRSLPRALAAGVLSVTVVYLAVNAGYLWTLPLDAMAASTLVAADAAGRAVGPGGEYVVAGLVALSTFGALQAAMMYNPRFFFAMSRDGLLFRSFGRVHEAYETPHLAVVLTTGLGIVYVTVRTFEQLAEAFILGLWPFHVAVILGLVVLRLRRPEAERPYRVWGYPATPLLFVLVSILMVGAAVAERPGTGLASFGAILLGVPVYLLVRGGSGTPDDPPGTGGCAETGHDQGDVG